MSQKESQERLLPPEEDQSATSYAWIKYALLTAISMGFVNYLLGDLSARLGVAGSFPIFYGIVVMGIVYHLVVKNSTTIYILKIPVDSDPDIINESNDASYHRSEISKFHWAAFWGILIRGLNHMVLITITFLAFKYATLADINHGVIASLFTSGVIFTSILFYFIYDEKLTLRDVIGIIFILAGVALIGIGKEDALAENEDVSVH